LLRLSVVVLSLSACTEYNLGDPKDGANSNPTDTSTKPVDTADSCEDQQDDTADTSAPPDCGVTIASACEVEIMSECMAGSWTGTVTDPWDVVVEWNYGGLSSDSSIHNAITAPLVGNLTDDDGDGDVDQDDTPDVVTVVCEGSRFGYGTLVALDGATGTELWTRSGYSAVAGGVLADIDCDGVTDVVVFDNDLRVVALDADGNELWRSRYSAEANEPQATVADLDGDGSPEIIAGDLVLDGATGGQLHTLVVAREISYSMPAVGDIDLDGVQEIILGNSVFDGSTGDVEWSAPLIGTYGHWAAILDYDGDPEGEVAMVAAGSLHIYDSDGTLLVSSSVGSSQPGPPCVADFDGDGTAEIAWASKGEFNLCELDGTLVWSQIVDDSSGLAACSGYDFDADGAYEILYADQEQVYIFDGATGTVRFSTGDHSSGTVWEYPVVADVDNDGSAEIIYTSNDYGITGGRGVTVLGHSGSGWPRSGPTWHVHDFAVTNIDPDGHVPAVPDPPWQVHNVYRARPAADGPDLPNLSVHLSDMCIASCDLGPIKLSFQVFNQGAADVEAEVPWALYMVDSGVATAVRTGTLDAIAAGTGLEGFVIELTPQELGDGGFIMTIDDDGMGQAVLLECDEDDNQYVYSDSICD